MSTDKIQWTDESALEFLRAQGFYITDKNQIRSPTKTHIDSIKEASARDYLFTEWDYTDESPKDWQPIPAQGSTIDVSPEHAQEGDWVTFKEAMILSRTALGSFVVGGEDANFVVHPSMIKRVTRFVPKFGVGDEVSVTLNGVTRHFTVLALREDFAWVQEGDFNAPMTFRITQLKFVKKGAAK